MRNYGSGSDLRRDNYDDEEEPELQWLEDGVHCLAGLTCAFIGALFSAFFLVIGVAFQAFKKTK